LSGVEFIIQAVTELRSKIIHEQKLSMDEIIDTIQVISTCTKNMTSTNCFMLMAINRCIDYTKASKGLKLNPKYETIDLFDTLALPLNTMAAVQGDIEIRLNPIPKAICSHIITDKQWLQENVLCLLSNAVKYSSEGLVTISVTLGHRSKNKAGILSKVKTMVVSRRKVYAAPDDDEGNEYDESIDRLLRGETVTVGTNELSPVAMKELAREKTAFEKLQQREEPPSPEVNDRLSKTAKAYQDHNHDDLGEKNVLTPRSERNQQQINNSGSTINDDSKIEKKKLKKPEGNSGNEVSLRHPASNVESFLRFEIEDTGIGISEEIMPHLFSPFKQAQRYSGGTGLGLYSLAKRIESLKGRCGVTARRDGRQGSLFWFEIPYKPDRFTSNLSKTKETNIYTNSSDLSPVNHDSMNRMNWFKVPTSSAPPTVTDPNNLSAHGNSSKSPQIGMLQSTESHKTLDMNEESDPHHSPVRTPINMSPKNFSPMVSNQNIIEASSMSPGHAQKIISSPSFKLKVPKNSLNILIVDDAASILKMTSMILKRGGHQITTACNGADALNKIIHGANKEKDPLHFDIIIMDLQMPVMDGLEATRRIRKLELTGDPNASSKKNDHGASHNILSSNAPIYPESDSNKPSIYKKHIIIGCSANSDDETIEESYKAGVDSFMAKPFSIDTFYEIYDSLINQSIVSMIPDPSSSESIESAKLLTTDLSKVSLTSVKSRSNSNPPSPLPHHKQLTNNIEIMETKIKLQKQLSRQITQSRFLLSEMNE
jgi:CheY-like chemotaxis protein/signal transduction histidine kinase